MSWLERSISRMVSERRTMNDLLMRTSFSIHGKMSKLSPIAICVVVGKPFSMSSTLSKAESSTMSR